MVNLSCPECGNIIQTTYCRCGWRSIEHSASVKQADRRCCYILGTRRCPLPGTISTHPYGNQFYCSGHYDTRSNPTLAEVVLQDAEENYESIMQQRCDWRDQLVQEYQKSMPAKKT